MINLSYKKIINFLQLRMRLYDEDYFQFDVGTKGELSARFYASYIICSATYKNCSNEYYLYEDNSSKYVQYNDFFNKKKFENVFNKSTNIYNQIKESILKDKLNRFYYYDNPSRLKLSYNTLSTLLKGYDPQNVITVNHNGFDIYYFMYNKVIYMIYPDQKVFYWIDNFGHIKSHYRKYNYFLVSVVEKNFNEHNFYNSIKAEILKNLL